MSALHERFRPRKFSEVIGQTAAVKTLQRMVKRGEQKTFLLTSTTAGVGKTTLARIAARAAGCLSKDVREIDAATHTGVDDMRIVTDGLKYEPFGAGKGRALIVDECHRLSGQAWDSLLKITEEPPPHVYWFFCTTRIDKVPATIKSRCAVFTLRDVNDKDLLSLYDRVADEERTDWPEDVVSLCVKEANGSARQLLVNLDLCREAGSKKEAAELLKSAIASDATRDLCRFLTANQGRTWPNAMKIMAKIDVENAEGVRIVVCNYVGKALSDAKSDKTAQFYLYILEQFAEPFNPSEKLAPLYLAVGRVIFGG